MGKPNRVMDLPPEIRQELDQRLRAANYGDLVAIAAWITARAHPVSKSGLGRYALGLKATDAARGHETAELLTHMRKPSARKIQLLTRLGQLEFERAQILAELAPLMADETRRDDPASMAAETGREPAEPSR